jgi:cytochrome b561
MKSNRDRYTGVTILLHWLLALFILGQIGFGWSLEEIPRGTSGRSLYVNLHKSIGMTLGLLIVFRLYWRATHTAPALPLSMPTWERTAAAISHRALYICMLVMPLTGYSASNFSKWGVNYFNVIKLPPWGIDDARIYGVLNTAHEVTSYVFVLLIAAHVLAALRHLTLRDGIFRRMWPAPRR